MKNIKQIKLLSCLFILCLVLSGITAFPLKSEIIFLQSHIHWFNDSLSGWINQVADAINQTPDIILYGTDWLAFAHLVIAVFFIGVFKNPIKNKFIVEAAIFACNAVFPLALIMGPIRGIPFFHQLIDCSFGLIGLIPLLIIYKKIKQIEQNGI